jgi:hypothetical protein
MINRDRLAALRKIEDKRFLALHPKSGELFKADKRTCLAESQCHGWPNGLGHIPSL